MPHGHHLSIWRPQIGTKKDKSQMDSGCTSIMNAIDYLAQSIGDPVAAYCIGSGDTACLQAEIDRATLLRPAKVVFVDLLLPADCDNGAELLRPDPAHADTALLTGRPDVFEPEVAGHLIAPHAPTR